MDTEVFRQIKGYEGLYAVSNLGRIYSYEKYRHNGKFLKQNIRKDGYMEVGLSLNKNRKTFSVHRLVANAFVENDMNLPEVNHKDGDKANNIASNLEWVTSSENQIHAIKNGLQKFTEKHRVTAAETCRKNGKRNKGKPNMKLRKLSNEQEAEIIESHKNGISMRKLGEKYNVDKSTISNIIRGKRVQ